MLAHNHLEFPYHTFVHCKGFVTAAPRRAGGLVSVPLSGPRLPSPVQIIALVGRYPTNWLICRRPILGPNDLKNGIFQYPFPIGYYLQFPEVIPVPRASCPRVTEPFADLAI